MDRGLPAQAHPLAALQTHPRSAAPAPRAQCGQGCPVLGNSGVGGRDTPQRSGPPVAPGKVARGVVPGWGQEREPVRVHVCVDSEPLVPLATTCSGADGRVPRGCTSLHLLSSCPGHSLVSYLWPQTYLTREEGAGHPAPPAEKTPGGGVGGSPPASAPCRGLTQVHDEASPREPALRQAAPRPAAVSGPAVWASVRAFPLFSFFPLSLH